MKEPPWQAAELLTGQAVGFAETAPLSEIAPEEAAPKPETAAEISPDQTPEAEPVREIPLLPLPFNPPANQGLGEVDPFVGLPLAVPDLAPEIPTPGLSFDGLSSQNNSNVFGFRVHPPDPCGDVGPNHYVQTVNLLVRVFNKAGAALTGPAKLSSLFSALGPPCGANDDGDAIVLYDPLADRWLISQFCTVSTPYTHQLIAISKTGDPTGAYYVYDFLMPNDNFNDYPKFGVWPDGYYMTDNQFGPTSFQGAGVFAFDRQKMLQGDPTAGYIYFSFPTNTGGMLPADFDGLIAPPPGAPNYFAQFAANEFGAPADALRIYEFHADFAKPSLSTFRERPESPVPVAAFDPSAPDGRNTVPQPPPAVSTNYLDAISDRLMFRLQYRNFGAYESLVVCHTVAATLSPYRAGVRYYQLRRNLSGGNFAVSEQATYAPDSNSRWMGSAAIDYAGNLAVGYSVSSTTVFPSVRYAGRKASDPANGLFQGEATLVAGSGVQRSTSGRWGDYSMLAVDPVDDCTFWYTAEYYTAASQASSTVGWLTRIGSFKVDPLCPPAPQGVLSGRVYDALTLLPISNAVVRAAGGFSRSTPATGLYSLKLAPGSYDASASAFGYRSASVSSLAIGNGATVVQDFALSAVPVVAADGTAVLAESCAPANGAADANETITFNFGLKNIGFADTANLVATLMTTGGVFAPSGPQLYGVLSAGGTAVARPFAFTVDPARLCGQTITPTLQLQDGTNDLGLVSFTLALGAPGPVTASSYASGNIAVPIPDVSTVEIPINVSEPGTFQVADVNVRVRLNHTFDSDLVLSLIHPDGTQVILAANRGLDGDNYGSGATNCSGTSTLFDDSATVPIGSGVAPFAGSFKPETPLSALNGKPVNGTWRLRVSDVAGADVGTVFCVQLDVSRRHVICCPCLPQMQAAPPVTVLAEGCSPANGAIDPNETVTVGLPLRNFGDCATANLIATLLPGGGVFAPSGAQSYGAVSPTGVPVSRPFAFVAGGPCGGTITATLHLQDGANDLGNVSFSLKLGAAISRSGSFTNAGSITIPAGAPSTTLGPASPYPSIINVSGLAGPVSKVTAQLVRLNHTFPADIDILLVGPGGQKLLLMSDVGSGFAVTNVTLTFDDAASQSLPVSGQITSGTYKPSNSDTADAFPAPAPAGPYPDPQLLSVFNGTNPNGQWRLFVYDDAGADVGNINGGWRLTINTAEPSCCAQACALNCPGNILATNSPGFCGTIVTFPDPTLSGNCGVVAVNPPSGSFFQVGPTTVTATAMRPDGQTTNCSFSVTVRAPTDTTVSAAAGQYSDVVNLSAQVANSVCPGGQVRFSIDGAAVGSSLVDSNGMATLTYQIAQGQGNHSILAEFTSSKSGVLPSSGSNTLLISREDATVTPSPSNPFAAPVSSPGGTAASVTLLADIAELSDGSAGDSSLAVPVTMTCVPVGPGGNLNQTATVSGGGVGGTLTARCLFTNVPVNVYDITIAIGGDYYNGSASTVLAVFDPSLGFVTGGGLITHNGYSANFGCNVKYLKSGQVQGSLLFIEHRPTGDHKLKSNALQSLSVVGNTAVILGKATLNGVGNYTFRATIVDNGEPGSSDLFGLQVNDPAGAPVGDLTFAPTTLTGGNVQVPQPSAR